MKPWLRTAGFATLTSVRLARAVAPGGEGVGLPLPAQ